MPSNGPLAGGSLCDGEEVPFAWPWRSWPLSCEPLRCLEILLPTAPRAWGWLLPLLKAGGRAVVLADGFQLSCACAAADFFTRGGIQSAPIEVGPARDGAKSRRPEEGRAMGDAGGRSVVVREERRRMEMGCCPVEVVQLGWRWKFLSHTGPDSASWHAILARPRVLLQLG